MFISQSSADQHARTSVYRAPLNKISRRVIALVFRFSAMRDKLTPSELEELKSFIEHSEIEEISDEIRALVEKHWPWLLDKLPPRVVH